MEILTNEVKIVLDNINSKFNIYALRLLGKKGDREIFSKVNMLIDSFKNNGDIYSIYRCGSTFKIYFLVSKGNTRLTKEDLFDKNVLEYFEENNLIKEFGIDNSIEDIDKLNLLLNSIKNYNFNDEKYECFDGKLYEIIKSKKDYVIALKYYFDDMCLKADVVTFREYKNYNNDKRVFHINGKYLSKTAEKGCGYIIEGESGTKSNLDYFSGKSIASLENCKIYRIMNIYNRFNELHSDVYKICFQKDNMIEKKFERVNHKTKSDRKKALEIVRNIGINIIDNVNNKEFLEKMKNYFEEKSISFIISDNIVKEKLNLNVIYSKKYYDDNGLKDKHLASMDYVVQNIIFENDDNKLDKNKMNVVITEFVHKYELNQKKIMHHQHDNLIINKFIFGRIKKIKGKDKEYLRCELSIENGKIFINTTEEQKTESNKIKEQIYLKDKNNGLIYEIMLLPKYPLTEINMLVEAYQKTTKEINVSEDLIPILDEYLNSNYRYKKILERIKSFVKKYDVISMSQLYSEIKKDLFPEDKILKTEYSNCLKELNKYLWSKKNKNIYFKPLWRSKNQPIKQAFEKFKYRYDTINYFQYYSGCCNSLNQSIYNGFPYRKIKYEFSDQEINDYLSLLDVDDVRNNQNTVIPYPFKYITEMLNSYVSSKD